MSLMSIFDVMFISVLILTKFDYLKYIVHTSTYIKFFRWKICIEPHVITRFLRELNFLKIKMLNQIQIKNNHFVGARNA